MTKHDAMAALRPRVFSDFKLDVDALGLNGAAKKYGIAPATAGHVYAGSSVVKDETVLAIALVQGHVRLAEPLALSTTPLPGDLSV